MSKQIVCPSFHFWSLVHSKNFFLSHTHTHTLLVFLCLSVFLPTLYVHPPPPVLFVLHLVLLPKCTDVCGYCFILKCAEHTQTPVGYDVVIVNIVACTILSTIHYKLTAENVICLITTAFAIVYINMA